MKDKKELRFIPFEFEVREEGEKPPKLVGYASVFNQESEIAGLWREKVSPGAYKKTIQENDIRALWNHNTDLVLGRNKAKTLYLEEDNKGLKVEIIPPDTQAGRDAITSIKRQDVSQMSLAFIPIKQEWILPTDRRDLALRVIKEARLFEVSPVTFPAFEETSINTRSKLYLPGEDMDPVEEAFRLLECAERGMQLSAEQRSVIRAAIEMYQSHLLEPDPDEGHHSESTEEPEQSGLDLDGHYSEVERARRLDALYQQINQIS
jgi:hypothetical protein